MTTGLAKRSRGKRRELAPLEPVEAEDGPAMKALPTDRHRAFVRAMYQVKPGHGAPVRAAKLAGFGTPQSSPQSMATIASRLTHDPRVQEAFAEQDKLYIRAAAPRAIRALSNAIEDSGHKDHMRAVAVVMDRIHPLESVHHVKVQHDATPSFKETAEVMERIAILTAKFNLPLPIVIEGRALETEP
jgi:alpha-beta hydrolase superfamily lysophospholipase